MRLRKGFAARNPEGSIVMRLRRIPSLSKECSKGAFL